MKRFKKILMVVCCVTMTFVMTGCGATKELKAAYNKMSVGEKDNQINGYYLNIRLFGIYNDEKVNESIRISNYLNNNFKVTLDDYTYYLIDGEKYKIESEDNDDMLSMFSASLRASTNYTETDEDIPFMDTDRYLVPLKSAKADDDAITETIGESEYTTYTYSVRKNNAQKLLVDTSLEEEKLKGNVPAKVWIDSEGYVYKIEYDISAGYETTNSLILTVYYSGIDNASDIVLDTVSTVIPGLEEEEHN